MRCRTLLVVLLLLCLARPASAGIIFGKKKTKPVPADRVPELISIVKNDGDENKRQNAAEELRQYDPAAFPAIVPALIEVLLQDKKPAVRSEAAQTLSKLRPVSQEVGQVLEQALHDDASMRVRLQVRSALLHYHWAGYHSGKDVPPVQALANEPPGTPPVVNTSAKPPPVMPQPAPTPARPTTKEPPLAAPAKLPTRPPSPAGDGPDLGPPS
jgi:hypothetical protein